MIQTIPKHKQRSFATLLISVFAILFCFPGSAAGETKKQALKEAYMVIADGSKSKAEAERKLEVYIKKGYPQYPREGEKDLYPKLMLSDEIKGLNPGFWIVVAAIADDEKVADTLSKFIRSLGQGSYVRQVWVEKPDGLRLLDLRFKSVLFEDWKQGTIKKIDSFPKYIKGFWITYSTGRKSIRRGKSAIDKKKYTSVIPYIHLPKHKKPYFSPELTEFHSFSCSPFLESDMDDYDYMYFSPLKKITTRKNFVIVCHSMEGD